MSRKDIRVQKADGNWQQFSSKKLKKFLERIKVPIDRVERIVQTVEKQSHSKLSTKEIAIHVTQLLQQEPKGDLYSARYNLKDLIRKMGPEGHNFEEYVSRLFQAEGYDTQVSAHHRGKCVEHEIDVVARKEGEFHMLECKFHNKEGIRSEITVAMYSYARFMDIHAGHDFPEHKDYGWLVTNTKLTTQALKYAECKNMRVLNVEFPQGSGIMDRVIEKNLYPITAIQVLNPYLHELLKNKHVMARDILNIDEKQAQQLGIPSAILTEAQEMAKKLTS